MRTAYPLVDHPMGMTEHDVETLVREGLALKATVADWSPVILAVARWHAAGTRRLLHTVTCDVCCDDVQGPACPTDEEFRRQLLATQHALALAAERLPPIPEDQAPPPSAAAAA